MKNAIMTLLLVSGMFLEAQEGERRGHDNPWKSMTPEQVATLESKKMTLALDLSLEQQSKMKSLLTTRAEERKARMEVHQEKKASGSEKPSTEERYTLANERLDKEIAFKKKVSQILNEVQYAEWKKMQRHNRHMTKSKMGKHGKRGERNERGEKK
jgi:hypothetical protein